VQKDGLQNEAKYEQALCLEHANFDVFAGDIIWQRVFWPMFGGVPDEPFLAIRAQMLESKFMAYDVVLSKREYLAGDKLTLADLFHLPIGGYLAPLGHKFLEDSDKLPNVAR
jgi:glutathione S-transferase